MSNERENIKRDRALLKERYGSLFEEVSAILFEEDLVGIAFETNTDEYEPEVGTILPKLGHACSSTDVAEIVREEFIRWFGPEYGGESETYLPVAERIWDAWRVFNQTKA